LLLDFYNKKIIGIRGKRNLSESSALFL